MFAQAFSWLSSVKDDRRFVRLRAFEGLKLRIEQASRHEVAGPIVHPAKQRRPIEVQQHEGDRLARRDLQSHPIAAFQGGAGRDRITMIAGSSAQRGADGIQPGPAIIIVEGAAGVHLRDVGGRMQVVALDHGDVQLACQHCGKGGFAAAADAHNDDGTAAAQHSFSFGLVHTPEGRRFHAAMTR